VYLHCKAKAERKERRPPHTAPAAIRQRHAKRGPRCTYTAKQRSREKKGDRRTQHHRLPFVSAEQKEGNQGVPTLQSKGREKRKATAAHSTGCHSSAPCKKRAKVYLHCKAKVERNERRPPHTASSAAIRQRRAKRGRPRCTYTAEQRLREKKGDRRTQHRLPFVSAMQEQGEVCVQRQPMSPSRRALPLAGPSWLYWPLSTHESAWPRSPGVHCLTLFGSAGSGDQWY
jgi:hypothetical protein